MEEYAQMDADSDLIDRDADGLDDDRLMDDGAGMFSEVSATNPCILLSALFMPQFNTLNSF
jgi:hypothetical protein